MKFRLKKDATDERYYSVQYHAEWGWGHIEGSTRSFKTETEAIEWFQNFKLIVAEREIEPPAEIQNCIIAEKETVL